MKALSNSFGRTVLGGLYASILMVVGAPWSPANEPAPDPAPQDSQPVPTATSSPTTRPTAAADSQADPATAYEELERRLHAINCKLTPSVGKLAYDWGRCDALIEAIDRRLLGAEARVRLDQERLAASQGLAFDAESLGAAEKASRDSRDEMLRTQSARDRLLTHRKQLRATFVNNVARGAWTSRAPVEEGIVAEAESLLAGEPVRHSATSSVSVEATPMVVEKKPTQPEIPSPPYVEPLTGQQWIDATPPALGRRDRACPRASR